MFIDIIYKAENCRLDVHAATYRQSYGMEDFDGIKGKIDEILALDQNNPRRYRFEGIMAQAAPVHQTGKTPQG